MGPGTVERHAGRRARLRADGESVDARRAVSALCARRRDARRFRRYDQGREAAYEGHGLHREDAGRRRAPGAAAAAVVAAGRTRHFSSETADGCAQKITKTHKDFNASTDQDRFWCRQSRGDGRTGAGSRAWGGAGAHPAVRAVRHRPADLRRRVSREEAAGAVPADPRARGVRRGRRARAGNERAAARDPRRDRSGLGLRDVLPVQPRPLQPLPGLASHRADEGGRARRVRRRAGLDVCSRFPTRCRSRTPRSSSRWRP